MQWRIKVSVLCILFAIGIIGKPAVVNAEEKTAFEFAFLPMEDTKEGTKQVQLVTDREISFIAYQGQILFNQDEVEIVDIISETDGGMFVWNGKKEGKQSPVSIVYANTQEIESTKEIATIIYKQNSEKSSKEPIFSLKEVSVFNKEGADLYQKNQTENDKVPETESGKKDEENVDQDSSKEEVNSSKQDTTTKVPANTDPSSAADTKQEDSTSVQQSQSSEGGQSLGEQIPSEKNEATAEPDMEKESSTEIEEGKEQEKNTEQIQKEGNKGVRILLGGIVAILAVFGVILYRKKK